MTYRKHYIHDIEQAENQVSHLRLVVAVTGEDQRAGDDMVGRHL